jgi:hypothetical protein
LTSDRLQRQLREKDLVVSGTSWPIFLYKEEKFNEDEPWVGLFRSKLLVKVSGFTVVPPFGSD